MGFLGLLKFAFICFDFLAWPLIALGYPMFASIRAIETGSKYHMRVLVMYWTLFSIISLFEYTFVKIIDWIPFWYSLKLIATFWLVIPRFDGARHAYQILIRPYLCVNLQAVTDWFYKPKEEKHRKAETFLDFAEKYINDNGPEALEKLISSKRDCKGPDNSMRDTRVLEPEEKNAVATSNQLKETGAAQKANEMLEVTEKSASTEAKWVQNAGSITIALVQKDKDAATEFREMTPPETSAKNQHLETLTLKNSINVACVQKEKDATAEVKEMTPPEVSAKNQHLVTPTLKRSINVACVQKEKDAAAEVKQMTPPEASAKISHPETPPVNEVQQEWTCALCQVKTTSEKTLNAHLRGNRHKSKCESLKKSKLNVEGTGPLPSATGKSRRGNPKANKSKAGEGSQQKSSKKTEERVQFDVPSGQQKQADLKQDGAATRTFKPWCNVCNVKSSSEIDLASHLKGKRHLSNIEKMVKLEGVAS